MGRKRNLLWFGTAEGAGALPYPAHVSKEARSIIEDFKEDKDEKTKAKIAWGKHWIDLGFQSLEKALSQTAGKYCVGDSVTVNS